MPNERSFTAGLALSLGAYTIWGAMPGYFLALSETSPWEIVAWRVLASLIFCLVLLACTGGWRRLLAILQTPRTLFALAIAGVLVYLNWQIYVFAALGGQVLGASLGYFINPLITVVLGVLVFRERLRPMQWIALSFAGAAIVVILIGYGSFPWISLALACSFGFYGLIKKRVGGQVDALSGLVWETAWLTPVALIQMLIVGSTIGISFGQFGTTHALLLLGSGIITATPLIMFAGAARRLPLVTLGLTQYLAPVLQFLTGVFLLNEPMPLGRWIGFSLVWVALVIFSVDVARASRPQGNATTVSNNPVV